MSRGFSRNNLPRPLEKAQQDSAPRRTAEMRRVIARADLHNNPPTPPTVLPSPLTGIGNWLRPDRLSRGLVVYGSPVERLRRLEHQSAVSCNSFVFLWSSEPSQVRRFFGGGFFQNEIRKRTWEEVSCQKDSVISTWNKKKIKIKCDKWRNIVSALWSHSASSFRNHSNACQHLPHSGSSKGMFHVSVTYIYFIHPSWASHQFRDKQPSTLTFPPLTTLELPS